METLTAPHQARASLAAMYCGAVSQSAKLLPKLGLSGQASASLGPISISTSTGFTRSVKHSATALGE